MVTGKEDLDRQTMDEMDGARRGDYEAALRAAGITRHAVWHQQTPNGTLALVYMQGDDAESAGKFASSDDRSTAGSAIR